MMRYKYCALLAVAAVLTISCSEKKVESAAPPPPDVEVVQVTPQDVPVTKEWVGTLKGLVNADIRSQVAGYVIKQDYVNGTAVKKGDVLFEIDPRPFQAAVDKATADVQQARAALQQARADLEKAQATQAEAKANQEKAEADQGKTQIDVTRYTPLAAAKAISQQELDNAVQANLAAKAQVEAMKASVQTATANISAQNANIAAQTSSIAAAQAALENAQVNLGFTKVTSLIDGVAGIANAQVGDSVGPTSPNPLTTVSTVDPILVQFSASEQEYLNAVTTLRRGSRNVDSALKDFTFELVLADGSVYPDKGKIQYIDREVDVRTGSINVQVAFPNNGNVLRPGGYGTIRSVVRTERGALAVPQRAVSELQGRFTVAVVGPDGKVALREVKTGDKVGAMWVINEGLKAGDRVVAEGTQKVREGMQVNPKPYQAPAGKAGA
jgi:membrane fusion protein (multidrug efflux system)